MRIGKTLIAMTAAVAFAAGLAACGEREQVIVYKQGKYQGKPDDKPWQNARWSSKDQWEAALKSRNLTQNEYEKVQ